MAKTPPSPAASTPDSLEAVTGVHLMQGIGHRPAQGFWTEAWSQVVRRPGAVFGLVWLTVVAFFAVTSPLLASGHPVLLRTLNEAGEVTGLSSPMLERLTASDVLLVLGSVFAIALLVPRLGAWPRSGRLSFLLFAGLQVGLLVVLASSMEAFFSRPSASDEMRAFARGGAFPYVATLPAALVLTLLLTLVPFTESVLWRVAGLVATGAVGAAVIVSTWNPPLQTFTYRQREAAGQVRATYTLIPYSPGQGSTALDLKEPWATPLSAVVDGLLTDVARSRGGGGFRDDRRWQVASREDSPLLRDVPLTDDVASMLERQLVNNSTLLPAPRDEILAGLEAGRGTTLDTLEDAVLWLEGMSTAPFVMGTDANGQDVLSQMMHACRLSISIGLVSTGIAVVIGVTMGALMGYFGGWVDMALYRVVEIFMAIPVLFLLIVAAAVLPRNTYVMMIIIGCVTWTGAARFIRAEFYKLRGQDFVQSARSVGLPLRSILFKHMLPNGVTPVLVESSFAIAAAILFEAILSYLGLGPANQPSWGRLLSDATNQVGDFVWWLAIFPGAAIFLTVLSYNLIGEALRDAIDPKLKKARV